VSFKARVTFSIHIQKFYIEICSFECLNQSEVSNFIHATRLQGLMIWQSVTARQVVDTVLLVNTVSVGASFAGKAKTSIIHSIHGCRKHVGVQVKQCVPFLSQALLQ